MRELLHFEDHSNLLQELHRKLFLSDVINRFDDHANQIPSLQMPKRRRLTDADPLGFGRLSVETFLVDDLVLLAALVVHGRGFVRRVESTRHLAVALALLVILMLRDITLALDHNRQIGVLATIRADVIVCVVAIAVRNIAPRDDITLVRIALAAGVLLGIGHEVVFAQAAGAIKVAEVLRPDLELAV